MDLELDSDLYRFKMIRLVNQSFWEGNVRISEFMNGWVLVIIELYI